MFKTTVGAVDTGDDSGLAYLRPETAQGMFVNFGNVLDTMRRKLPFGIAQIGKAFRNEITPGNFTFRTREFEQMEIEYFVRPGEDEAAHQAWIDARIKWYLDLGLRAENLKQREQTKDELAHYAKRCVDLEYRFPMGWSELEGIANRTDYDLSAHSRGPEQPRRRRRAALLRPGAEEAHRALRDRAVGGRRSRDAGVPVRRLRGIAGQGAARGRGGQAARAGRELRPLGREARPTQMDADVKERLVAAGQAIAAGLPGTLPRLLGLSDDADANRIEVFKKVRGVGEKLGEEFTRTVLRLHPRLAPIKVAVFPLKKNEPRLVEMARAIKGELQAEGVRDRLRRHGRHREALSAPGRDRDPVLHHGRLPEPGGRHRHGAGSGQHGTGAGGADELPATLRKKSR